MNHAALVVNQVGLNHQQNLDEILVAVKQVFLSGATLVLMPEAAVTGMIINDDPVHDLPLGEEIPGPMTKILCTVCQKYKLWLGIGLLERDNNRLYDSAILIDDTGQIVFKYRRIQPQWHAESADPAIYQQGSELVAVTTPFGTLTFLICGDLFDNDIVDQFRSLKPDVMLFPFARCFPDGLIHQNLWDTVELPEYIDRVKLAGTPALMVNYLAGRGLNDGNTFGGAFAISADGTVIASYPLGLPGILYVDIDELHLT